MSIESTELGMMHLEPCTLVSPHLDHYARNGVSLSRDTASRVLAAVSRDNAELRHRGGTPNLEAEKTGKFIVAEMNSILCGRKTATGEDPAYSDHLKDIQKTGTKNWLDGMINTLRNEIYQLAEEGKEFDCDLRHSQIAEIESVLELISTVKPSR